LPHGSDQQCAHFRTAAPLIFSFYPPGGGYTPLPRISRQGALPNACIFPKYPDLPVY